MAKASINMNGIPVAPVTEPVVDSTKIKESKAIKPANTPSDGSKSSDNTSEIQGDIEKTEEGARSAEPKVDTQETPDIEFTQKDTESDGKVLIQYVGNSIWRDEKGKLWKHNAVAGTSIIGERVYSKAEYEEREDLKFMVSYGEMKITEM